MEKKNIKKIAVFRALSLGDLLCIIPAIRALREAFLDASITFIGMSRSKEFAERFSRYFDKFLEFPGYPGLSEQKVKPQKVTEFLKIVQQEKFDLVLQMQDDGLITNPFISLFNTKNSAGFYIPGYFQPNENLFFPYPKNQPEIKRYLKLMELLGITSKGKELEFPINFKERIKFEEIKSIYGLEKGQYICIHPGARDEKRRWLPEYFAKVANFVSELGFQVVFTGTTEDKKTINAVKSHMEYFSIDLCNKTPLGVLGALLEEASLLVSNNTDISCLADALNVPSVTIFTNSDTTKWSPFDTKLHVAINKQEANLPDLVINEVHRLLEETYTFHIKDFERTIFYE